MRETIGRESGASRDFTLLDGGVGTSLAARGVDARGTLFSAQALLDPRGRERLREVHRDFARAGAQVLTAATFRTSRRSLERAGMGARFPALAIEAVMAAREGAEQAASAPGAARARIAGSLAPLEDCCDPTRSPAAPLAFAEHLEHARALARAGCQLFLVETICAAPEGLAAIRAAASTGLPVWASAQSTPRGTLPDGSALLEFFRDARKAGAGALLLNCTPCDGIDASLEAARTAALEGGARFGAYAQLGEIDLRSGWASGVALEPLDYAKRAAAWLERGASILGGCCGAGPLHIAALARLRGR